jgi:acetylornithine/N-succinyldiaminopimelate aminotransferase
LTTARVAAALTPGAHGSTFGGNPVACAAAVASVKALVDPALLENVRRVGAHFRARLEAIRGAGIREVRGMGLMLGAELDRPGAPVVTRCLEDGLLINCTADRVLRFLPPLVITGAQVDEGFAILERALAA